MHLPLINPLVTVFDAHFAVYLIVRYACKHLTFYMIMYFVMFTWICCVLCIRRVFV